MISYQSEVSMFMSRATQKHGDIFTSKGKLDGVCLICKLPFEYHSLDYNWEAYEIGLQY
jgi:hypothetical protein